MLCLSLRASFTRASGYIVVIDDVQYEDDYYIILYNIALSMGKQHTSEALICHLMWFYVSSGCRYDSAILVADDSIQILHG